MQAPAGLGAGCVEIPSNLLISSGCLGLSGLNLTEGGGGGGTPLHRGGGGGGLVGLEGLVHGAGGRGLFRINEINSAFLNRE